MTTETHTPGPWFWLSGGHITTTVGPDWASHEIAEVHKDGADARLMAAAPDLLEALQDLLHYGATGEGNVWDAMNNARTAIKRATGKPAED